MGGSRRAEELGYGDFPAGLFEARSELQGADGIAAISEEIVLGTQFGLVKQAAHFGEDDLLAVVPGTGKDWGGRFWEWSD